MTVNQHQETLLCKMDGVDAQNGKSEQQRMYEQCEVYFS